MSGALGHGHRSHPAASRSSEQPQKEIATPKSSTVVTMPRYPATSSTAC
jgi:hypothetical protein